MAKHLYREGGERKNLPSFEKRYGKRGKEVYGATVGKVHREQELNRIRERLRSARTTPNEKAVLRRQAEMLENELK